ncbi:hypothetical protein, partial [Stomatohabitans albus]
EHTVEQVAQVKHAQGLTSAEPIVVSVDIPVTTPRGRTIRIVDRMTVYRRSDQSYVIVAITASSYKSRTTWALWVPYLILNHAFAGRAIDVTYLYKDRYKGFKPLGFIPIPADQANTALNLLVATVETGLMTPLVAPLATALAWSKAAEPDARSIRQAWEGSSFGFDMPEAKAGSVVRLLGGNLPAEWVIDQRIDGGRRHLDVVSDGLWKPMLDQLPNGHPELRGRGK